MASSSTRRVTLGVFGDIRDIQRKLNWVKSEKKDIESDDVNVNVNADTAKAAVNLDNLRDKLAALTARSHDVNIGADDKEATAKLDNVRYKLARLEHTVSRPRVSVTGAARAMAELSAIDLALDRIDGREAKPHVSIPAPSAFPARGMALGAGISGIVAQGLALLPALGAAGGAGLIAALGGAVMAGTPKVKAAFSRMATESLATLRSAFSPITPYLTGVANQVSGIIWGIAPQIRTLASTIGPMLKPMVAAVGDALKGFLPGLVTLMQSAQPAIKATAGLIASLGTNIGKMLAAFAPAMGAASEIMTSFGNAVLGLLPVIGELAAWIAVNLRDALVNVGPALAGLIGAIADLLKPVLLGLRPVLSIIIGGLGLFAEGLRIIAEGLGHVPGPLRVVILALPLLAAALWAVSANPIVAIVGGIVLVVGAIAKYWPQITGAFRDLGKLLTDVFRNVKNFVINDFIHPVVSAFLNFAGWIINTAATAFGWIPGIGGGLRNAAKAFGKFKDDVNASLDRLTGKTITVGANFLVQHEAVKNPKTGKVMYYSGGGPVYGPGTTTSDSVDARLSKDEYVVSASAHKHYGTQFLDAVNRKRLASGGVALRTHLPDSDSVGRAVNSGFMATAQTWLKSLSAMGDIGGSGVARWSGLVLEVLRLLGQSAAWLGTVLRRINQESGGNPYAINLTDSNAKAGYPSQGLMQTIPQTFAAYAGPFRGLGITNPLANIYAGLNYAIHRYGTLAALNRPGGYDLGGILQPGYTLAYNGTGHDELVVNPALAKSQAPSSYTINVYANPLAHPADVGREVVNAIKEFESTAGKSWRS